MFTGDVVEVEEVAVNGQQERWESGVFSEYNGGGMGEEVVGGWGYCCWFLFTFFY